MSDSNTSRATVVAAVVAVAAVILGVVLFQVLGDDGGDGEGAAVATAPETTQASPEASPSDAAQESPAAGECTSPPPLPTSVPSFDEAPSQDIAEDSVWKATLTTSCGDIVLELFGDKAPQTVSSFIFLAREGYWKDSPCHRLVPQGIYVLQCGDPTGTGTGGPGYGYGIENAPADGTYPRGTLAMARTQDPNSNGGQFFIVFEETALPVEGGGYSIFGEVVEGMDIVDAIAEAGVAGGAGDGAPAQPISILDVTVEKKA
ncbi:MAG TPA: peptidylprolyl isomerase [Nocardioidaceae bacterium]|nr:peptidylprolyl isomerase [Nocardioidaceae bacterium]